MFLSETLALSAALCIALSGMLISELKGRVDVFRLARWQMLAAFAMTGAAMLAPGSWRTVGWPQAWQLAASSLFGIIIASTTYFAAIYTAGPRRTALLMAALATGNVGIVTTLSSMTPIMILPMVWIRSGVAPVKEAWFGALLAVAGTAAISL